MDHEQLTDLRRQISELSDRLEDVEVQQIRKVAVAIDLLEFLKGRAPGWATNQEMKDLVGNSYVSARAALVILSLAEMRRTGNKGTDDRGVQAVQTRYVEGGSIGRVSRERVLNAALYGSDMGS